MARKLSDREWEVWAEFLSSPRFQELAKGLARQASHQRDLWASRLWAMQAPDPSDPSLLEVRVSSQTFHNLSQLGQVNSQTRQQIEELLHDIEPERDKPD